jgi:hypothetical protein
MTVISATPARIGRTRSFAIAAVGAVMFVAGCAPDSVNSRGATGFNAYLSSLKTCKPLEIGSTDLSVLIDYNNSMMNQNYQFFVDQTSMLYYNRLSPDQYRQTLTAFLGAGWQNEASFNCIFSKLPADRPNAPVAR